jgi:hypothetical protein
MSMYSAGPAPKASVAGFYAQIDPKSAIWNKPLNVTQVPGLVYTPTQLDALTQARINVLRFKGSNNPPVLLHDYTAALPASDFCTLLRMNIHDLVINTLEARCDQFEGQATLGGLQMTSMKTVLDQDMVKLSQRGYVNKATIWFTSTQVQTNLGQD